METPESGLATLTLHPLCARQATDLALHLVFSVQMESATDVLSENSDEQQLPNFTIPFTPRYAEHFMGAAALIAAFGLVLGAMALGATSDLANEYCLCKPVLLYLITTYRRVVTFQNNTYSIQVLQGDGGTRVSVPLIALHTRCHPTYLHKNLQGMFTVKSHG